MITVAEIMNAVLAPFGEQVGMQGFAYGLLGLKTLKKMFEFIRERAGRRAEYKRDQKWRDETK